MKKTMFRMLICLIILLIAPVTLAIMAFGLPPQYEETFLGELKYKVQALQQTEGKRIIVIGGSSVAFGQDSELMAAEFPGYRVINFGMYAGLGSTVMLDLAKPWIREDDIVIVSPEQNTQTLSLYFNGEAMWQAADGDFQMLFDLSSKNIGAMIGRLGYFAAQKFNYFRDGTAPIPEGIYRRDSFNAAGDIDSSGREQNIMSGGFDPNTPIKFAQDMISEEFISYLNSFAQTCQNRGATVLYRFCPMNAMAITTEDGKEMETYYEFLKKRLAFPIIDQPQTSVMAAEWFYDTNFHLNASGAVVNTRALVVALKQQLNDISDTKIILPPKPSFRQSRPVPGDNSDENCFLYLETDDAFRLVGLTSEGRKRSNLILPTTHKGQPVTTFAPTLFAGNTRIEEILVQSSYTCIENLSFAGCTALRRLRLTHVRPEDCSVGNQLLTGTAGNVYVPKQSLDNYLINYFWSNHAGRILADPKAVYADPDHGTATITPTPSAPIENETITYSANGGAGLDGNAAVAVLPQSTGHLRVNTALGSQLFARAGYVLMGWNTQADGIGTTIGFGSRTEKADDLVLYAQWAKAAPEADFLYNIEDDEIRITQYLGNSQTCAIPEKIAGLPVRRICQNAFAGAPIDVLVLPPSIFAIEKQAFAGSTVREIYLYDSLYYVYDESFADCANLTTLHINAATLPVYSGTYFDTFSDKYDWLLSIKDRQKIVLFSGSSGRFGYDSPQIIQALPDYEVANMGVYAYTNALPQLMIIKDLMQEGDILLSAPEFDTIHNQFCTENTLDARFFAMMESNYDAVSGLDLGDYSGVFDSLQSYLTTRSVMGGKSYSITPANYDDDGKRYNFSTYNQYGDFTLPRPNGTHDVLLKTYLADYTTSSFPEATLQSINAVYKGFLAEGIRVYFTYAPRNWSSLTAMSTVAEREKLQAYFEKNICVPVISNVEDYLYSGIYFYLIDNHLSTEGVRMRTQQVVADIRAQLAAEN